MRTVSILALLVTSALPAQRTIATVFAGTANAELGKFVARIGDADNDGRDDLLVTATRPTPRLHLISSATRQVLGTVFANFSHSADFPIGIADINQDGRADFLVTHNNILRACSGNGAVTLWNSALPVSHFFACGIGDVDGDTRPDVAAVVTLNNNPHLVMLRGSDGTQVGATSQLSYTPTTMAAIGDQNNDGRIEVALGGASETQIHSTGPFQFLRQIANNTGSNARDLAAANVAGDVRPELLVRHYATIYAYSGSTGALVRTYAGNEMRFAVIGDLDADGFDDLAVFDTSDNRQGSVPDPILKFVSGASGAVLARWGATTQFRPQMPAGLGDIDDDGAADLLLGDDHASLTGNWGTAPGGWQLVSGRILANQYSFAVQCTGGPFAPEIGMSRPVLGQTVTIVGRDCPTTAAGTLVVSPEPQHPTNLGVTGCNAWFDLGSGSALFMPPPTANWTIAFPLPNVPQLAGLAIALQAFYAPTNSPIGIDLSNAYWARLGF